MINSKKGLAIHIIGHHCSGKKTICNILNNKLKEITNRKITFISEHIKLKLAMGLKYNRIDRAIQIKRLGYICSEIVKHGGIVIFFNDYPYLEERDNIRNLILLNGNYIEVYLDTPISVCKERDTNGLYKLAMADKISDFPGVDIDYKGLEFCDIILNGSNSLDENINILLKKILTIINK